MTQRQRRILRRLLLIAAGLAVLVWALLAAFLQALNPVLLGVEHEANGQLVSSGTERDYLLYVPDTYRPETPAPLVISLHGAALWPTAQRKISRWNDLADRHGLLVVYPTGTRLDLPIPLFPTLPIWDVRNAQGWETEARFLADLIDHLESSYAIDPRRIYLNGLSNGGAMTFVASCHLADRLAAVGTVAAAQGVPWETCSDLHPLPFINFHGTDDAIVPYEGGKSFGSPQTFADVRRWTQRWAERNGCDGSAESLDVRPDVEFLSYADCDDAPVQLYTLRGGGHTWPGGTPRLPRWLVGTTSQSIDATELMWEFFAAHPRPLPPDDLSSTMGP